MRYTVIAKSSRWLLVSAALIGAFSSVVWPSSAVFAATTGVYATICTGGSTITISQPVSDSTVNTATVPLQGTVKQANQIEIYVDDAFDSIIPLTTGQTSYSGSVQIAVGTHTIKVVAIDSCSMGNGEASSVVTYFPPQEQPAESGGGTSQTAVGGQTSGGVVVGGGGKVQEVQPGLQLPEFLRMPIYQGVQWLGITIGDHADGDGQKLSLLSATLMVVGLGILTFGMAAAVVNMVASAPVITRILPSSTPVRLRWIRIGFRGIGLGLLLSAFLL